MISEILINPAINVAPLARMASLFPHTDKTDSCFSFASFCQWYSLAISMRVGSSLTSGSIAATILLSAVTWARITSMFCLVSWTCIFKSDFSSETSSRTASTLSSNFSNCDSVNMDKLPLRCYFFIFR